MMIRNGENGPKEQGDKSGDWIIQIGLLRDGETPLHPSSASMFLQVANKPLQDAEELRQRITSPLLGGYCFSFLLLFFK